MLSILKRPFSPYWLLVFLPLGFLILASTVLASLFVYVNLAGNKITHDGSRTGPKVGYSSYCDPEGGYVIYENEKIAFTKDDGEEVFWTKEDIECYKDRKTTVLGKKKISSPTPARAPNKKNLVGTEEKVVAVEDPVIDCVSTHANCNGKSVSLKRSQCSGIFCCGFSDGRWELYPTEEKCKQAWAAGQPSNNNYPTIAPYVATTYYPCTLCYHYSTGDSCTTYENLVKTKEECDAEQEKINSIGSTYVAPTQQISTPTPVIVNTIDYTAQCKFDVNSYYSQQENNCMAQFGMGSSAGPACIEINRNNWNSALAACD